MEKLLESAKEIKQNKRRETIIENKDKAIISKKLVTLKKDVPLKNKIEEFRLREMDKDKLYSFMREMEFNRLLSSLISFYGDINISKDDNKKEINKKFPKIENKNYILINKEEEINNWLKEAEEYGEIAIDTETTSLDPHQAELVGISLSTAIGKSCYIPIGHKKGKNLNEKNIIRKLKPILEDKTKKKVGQNLKYDKEVFANYNINLQGIEHDTMLASYVVNSTATRHNLDALALNYLNTKTIRYEDVAGKGAKQIPFSQVTIEKAAPYAAEDAEIVTQLHDVLISELKKTPTLEKIYNEIEIPLLSVLCRIERNGVTIDPKMLKKQTADLKNKMLEIETKAHNLSKESFNISSPKQIQSILYDKLNLPVLAKTPKGQPSTAEPVLQELSEQFELPKLILEYRSMSKLCSTYTEKLPQMINKKTGRVHTSYHQAVTATGRLSSSDPNLQNIPIRTEEGRKIRQAFIAPKDYVIVAADYSQIELRIMAHLSKDKGLLTAFEKGLDVHKTTAAEVFAIDIQKVTKDQRRAAKAINFGLIYGMSAFGLAKQLGIERNDAKQYIDLYFNRYPDIKNFMDLTRNKAKQNGFVETVYGRRLYLPEINSKNAAQRQYAERTAINAPMQGTAADIIKNAMIDIDDWLNKTNFDAKMLMQVHDELVFEVHADKLEKFIKEVEVRMVKNNCLTVSLEIDVGYGNNWDEAH